MQRIRPATTRLQSAISRLLIVRRILCLWWIHADLDRLLRLIDIEHLAEGLISAGDDLDLNLALRNAGNPCKAFLIRLCFPGGPNLLDVQRLMAGYEAYDHA